MVPPNASNTKLRERAKIVRCDLQEQEGGACSNCKRRAQHCQRHNDRAGRVAQNRAFPSATASPVSLAPNPHDSANESFCTGQSGLSISSQAQSAYHQATQPPLDQPGYIGEQSLMSFSSSAPTSAMPNTGYFPEHVRDAILKVTNATSLPPLSKVQVFADTYFKHLYHIAPVIDRADLDVKEPSILLLQAICLIGSQLRYPRDQSPTLLSESCYLKIKTLIYVKHEHDNFAMLKTLCILCFWIVTPPVVVSFDTSYHWLGIAVRLAYQMGLHRESSYAKLSNPGAARRIIWFLFVADKLQAAAFGRPAFLLSQNMDLCPLGLEDFGSADTAAEIFIEYTKLNMLLERIVEFQDRKEEISREQVSCILSSLEKWLANLPSNLRLYDHSGRRIYRRGISELYIHYFTCVILFVHLYGQFIHPSMTPIPSLVASSCMARLYQEIDDCDETNYLTPIHNWSLMVGCIPQIHRNILLPEEHDLCSTELDSFVTALNCMRLKWPPANNILTTIDRLRTARFHPRAHTAAERQQRIYPLPASYEFPAPTLTSLFPFPKDMCPRMTLMNADLVESSTGMESAMSPAAEDFMGWIFDEFSLDYLNMPFVG
ncbi:fungal-specific transcription factor domain-containing protein [Aspergillus ambiguus]|uniref:fungal specific transcription factor domain-containing protein n=1 Tax=Aspergillus ambiguus TaxID=176160 RepID=UPI003CCCB94D